MAIAAESRLSAEIVRGSLVYFIPDGTTYGASGSTQESSRTAVPTFEEALDTGLCLGMLQKFKWGLEYKVITKLGFDKNIRRFVKRDRKILESVKPTFSTQDVVPETYAMEHGMDKVPAIGTTTRPFSNVSGSLRGWIYIQFSDALRTLGEGDVLAEIHLRGDLALADTPEYADDLAVVNYEFTATEIPEDAFKNVGIPVTLDA